MQLRTRRKGRGGAESRGVERESVLFSSNLLASLSSFSFLFSSIFFFILDFFFLFFFHFLHILIWLPFFYFCSYHFPFYFNVFFSFFCITFLCSFFFPILNNIILIFRQLDLWVQFSYHGLNLTWEQNSSVAWQIDRLAHWGHPPFLFLFPNSILRGNKKKNWQEN